MSGHGGKATAHVHGPGCGCGHDGHRIGDIHETAKHEGKEFDLVIVNIGTLATPKGRTARAGDGQAEISLTKDAWIGVKDGLITEVGGFAPTTPYPWVTTDHMELFLRLTRSITPSTLTIPTISTFSP